MYLNHRLKKRNISFTDSWHHSAPEGISLKRFIRKNMISSFRLRNAAGSAAYRTLEGKTPVCQEKPRTVETPANGALSRIFVS